MLRFSKKADYALLALQYLDLEARSGASARAIAERYDIPVELLAKVLQHLARLGPVVAHKGSHGGYHLARPSTAISVVEVRCS
jgi:Rrf2 family protein